MNKTNDWIDYSSAIGNKIALRTNSLCRHVDTHHRPIFSPTRETYLYPVSKLLPRGWAGYCSHRCAGVRIRACASMREAARRKSHCLAQMGIRRARARPFVAGFTMVNDDGPLFTATGKPSLKVSAFQADQQETSRKIRFSCASTAFLRALTKEDDLK